MNSNEENKEKDNINLESLNSEEFQIENKSTESDEEYSFGWSGYSETTNGRFAMLGFLAIILIEFLSKQSFLNWAGIIN